MLYGYASYFPDGPTVEEQIKTLQTQGCKKISVEINPSKSNRPERDKLFSCLKKGDEVIVTHMQVLNKTARQLIDILLDFYSKRVVLKSLAEPVLELNTTNGKLINEFLITLKTIDNQVKRINTIHGLKESRARGRNGGRKPGSYNKTKAAASVTLYNRGEKINDIMEKLGIKSKPTLYAYLRNEGVQVKGFKKSIIKR